MGLTISPHLHIPVTNIPEYPPWDLSIAFQCPSSEEVLPLAYKFYMGIYSTKSTVYEPLCSKIGQTRFLPSWSEIGNGSCTLNNGLQYGITFINKQNYIIVITYSILKAVLIFDIE